MLIVPVRTVVPPFAATVKLTVPLPVLPPVVSVRNSGLLLVAVQLQLAGAVTLTLPGPPFGVKDWLGAVSRNVHDAAVTSRHWENSEVLLRTSVAVAETAWPAGTTV